MVDAWLAFSGSMAFYGSMWISVLPFTLR